MMRVVLGRVNNVPMMVAVRLVSCVHRWNARRVSISVEVGDEVGSACRVDHNVVQC